jgi:hypothetical protein
MMSGRLALYGTLILVMCFPSSTVAAPVPCAGGTLDITAVSDTGFTLPTFNVGQRTLLTAVTTGFTATSYSWVIPPPHIKDYNEDLGTKTPGIAPLPWSTIPLTTADLTSPTVSLYWKPSAAQTHPLLGGPEARTVSLTVTPMGGGSCVSTSTYMIERNMSDPNKQPEDFYTSNHRASTATNPGFGRVVDEHIYWHQFVGGGPTGHWLQFLAWHSYFLRRFDTWRAEFGYDIVAPWYPGRPLPTGPAFDHPPSLRLPYNPDVNRIPHWFTIAGSADMSPGGQRQLNDFTTLDQFSSSFEFSYHGNTHCNIGPSGPDFFTTDGPNFGSMCYASSPKDPMFWRWHGFIDAMYRNYCKLHGISCHSGPDPESDAWMGDNAADIAANGNVPSPSPRWLSPDIWNRRAQVTTDACMPRLPPPNLITVGGVTRDCGSEADHENPVAGTTNYLYATLRNNRPQSVRNVYAEVAVYIANASTGLSWPTDFTFLPESRQFITVHLEPGQETDIGPLPWAPPSPAPSDHWCIYIRVLAVPEAPPVEGTNVDTNVANSNSIAWRNLKVVNISETRKIARFIVRNIQKETERLGVRFSVAPELFDTGRVLIHLDDALQKAFAFGKGEVTALRKVRDGVFALTEPKALISGIHFDPRQQGTATVEFEAGAVARSKGEIQLTQVSSHGEDGGLTLRMVDQGRPNDEIKKRDLKAKPRNPRRSTP